MVEPPTKRPRIESDVGQDKDEAVCGFSDLPPELVVAVLMQARIADLPWMTELSRIVNEAVKTVYRIKKIPSDHYTRHKRWSAAIPHLERTMEGIRWWNSLDPATIRWPNKPCDRAANANSIEILQLLWDNDIRDTSNASRCLSIVSWNRPIRYWLIEHNGINYHMLSCAAIRKDYEMIQQIWIHCGSLPGDWFGPVIPYTDGSSLISLACRCALAIAARHGDLDMVQTMIKNGCPVDARTMEQAASCGHLPVVQHLYTIRHIPGWTLSTCRLCIFRNQEHVLGWMHRRPRPEWPCVNNGGGTGPCEWAESHILNAQ
jgi:hypothetical protein